MNKMQLSWSQASGRIEFRERYEFYMQYLVLHVSLTHGSQAACRMANVSLILSYSLLCHIPVCLLFVLLFTCVSQVCVVVSMFPGLERFHCCENLISEIRCSHPTCWLTLSSLSLFPLSTLSLSSSSSQPPLQFLRLITLEENQLSSWDSVFHLSPLPRSPLPSPFSPSSSPHQVLPPFLSYSPSLSLSLCSSTRTIYVRY